MCGILFKAHRAQKKVFHVYFTLLKILSEDCSKKIFVNHKSENNFLSWKCGALEWLMLEFILRRLNL